MRDKKRMNSAACIFIVVLIMLLGFIDCVGDYPPMYEYQVVGYLPVSSAESGKLFISGEYLIVLYDTTYSYQWTVKRTYELLDPLNPFLTGILWFIPVDYGNYYLTQQDSFVFLYRHYEPLHLLNLNTLERVTIDVPYAIHALVYKDNCLFMSTDSGLVVWDITEPEYVVEVYNEHQIDSRWGAHMAFRDTILFECFRGYDYAFKFWNIKEPHVPQIIATGDFYYDFSGIGMTEHYIIGHYYSSIYRFAYDFSNSLQLEESKHYNYSINEFHLSDSLVYLLMPNNLCVVAIDDFDEEWVISSRMYNYRFLSQETYGNTIYALIRNDGVYIYERREP